MVYYYNKYIPSGCQGNCYYRLEGIDLHLCSDEVFANTIACIGLVGTRWAKWAMALSEDIGSQNVNFILWLPLAVFTWSYKKDKGFFVCFLKGLFYFASYLLKIFFYWFFFRDRKGEGSLHNQQRLDLSHGSDLQQVFISPHSTSTTWAISWFSCGHLHLGLTGTLFLNQLCTHRPDHKCCMEEQLQELEQPS